jgi:hypothetical protein
MQDFAPPVEKSMSSTSFESPPRTKIATGSESAKGNKAFELGKVA